MSTCWCIPARKSGKFVARMEEVLDVYQRDYDPDTVLVCVDETSKQLTRETRTPYMTVNTNATAPSTCS